MDYVPGTQTVHRHNKPFKIILSGYSDCCFYLCTPSKELRKLSEVFGDGCLADLALSLQYQTKVVVLHP